MNQKILLVDDDEEIVELIAYTLNRAGYESYSAFSGSEALAMLRELRPDLILLDVILPDVDGISLCEILRRQPRTTNTPIIMLTGMSGQFTRLIGLEAGASDYVTKPFSPRELLGRVQSALKKPAANTSQAVE